MELETFAPLAGLPRLAHAFTRRTLTPTQTPEFQETLLRRFGYATAATAEQVHGAEVAVATGPGQQPGVDALITRTVNLPLVIRCADCAAVYIFDRRTPAIALIHSGKKGTAGNIVGRTVAALRAHFATGPADCCAVISPCIGPCHYEVDLWAAIERQLQAAGVAAVFCSRICTACHLEWYYSYRAEKGRTGRMLALLALQA